MASRILIVEDESKMARVLFEYLTQAGFTPQRPSPRSMSRV